MCVTLLILQLLALAGWAISIPRNAQECEGIDVACSWEQVCMGRPTSLCSAPERECTQWFNGCHECDIVGGEPVPECGICIFMAGPTRCVRTVETLQLQSVVHGSPRGTSLVISKSCPVAPDDCVTTLSLSLPEPYTLVAIFGDDDYPMVIPDGLASGISPVRKVTGLTEGESFTSINIHTVHSGTDSVITDGAWFVVPPPRGTRYDDSYGTTKLGRFEHVSNGLTGGTLVFNAQIFNMRTHETIRLYGIQAPLRTLTAGH